MSTSKQIEVFQDLRLCGQPQRRAELRQALIETASEPWRHAPDAEEEMSAVGNDDDILAFFHERDDNLPAAMLVLWSRPDGYEVTNIVPRDQRELGYTLYNRLLTEFVDKVAARAAEGAGFRVETTQSHQSIDQWAHPAVVEALRRFSSAANKSTGSSHPLDQKRWFQFLTASYEHGGELGTDQLARWLIEVEGWSEEVAHNLILQYEFGLALLRFHESRRS
jgi:hypothetical protein